MKIYVAHSSDFDFRKKLYEPLRSSRLNTEHEILLPQEGTVEEITRDMIKDSDALIAEVSLPSLGAGIEMGWADSFHLPVIAIHEKGTEPSFSVDNVVTERIEYSDAEDMIQKITETLSKIV